MKMQMIYRLTDVRAVVGGIGTTAAKTSPGPRPVLPRSKPMTAPESDDRRAAGLGLHGHDSEILLAGHQHGFGAPVKLTQCLVRGSAGEAHRLTGIGPGGLERPEIQMIVLKQ